MSLHTNLLSTPMRLRFRLRALVLASFVACVLCLSLRSTCGSHAAAGKASHAACPQSPASEDVLLVLRTGATESHEKLPNHLHTTLTCVPDFIIYSDYDEIFEGNHIHDVLDGVNHTIRAMVPEFRLYNELKDKGREGLVYQTSFGSGPDGAMNNPGWRLDKWKFLPMVDRALRHRPNAKWFVFIESDTYMIWSNMLHYLSNFDPNQPYYIGKHMFIGDVLFAHGGSGFVLSRPALERVTQHWRDHKNEFEEYTANQWAGDMVLAKALRDVGIEMFWAYPHLQGDSVPALDWNISNLDRHPWCYAPLTFHHMERGDFRVMWDFEQQQLARKDFKPFRFRDVLKAVVYPNLRSKRIDWDNMSVETEYSDEVTASLPIDSERSTIERAAHHSFDNCRAACEERKSCLQFSYVARKCLISSKLRLGNAAAAQCLDYNGSASKCLKFNDAKGPVSSGWILDRVHNYMLDLDATCDGPDGNDWAI